MAPVPGDCSKTPVWHVDAARGPSTPSFDHLVGDGEYARRNSEAKHPCSLKIDNQLELGRLQHRQIGGLLTLENAAGIDARLAICVLKTGPIAHQAPADDKVAIVPD